MNYENELNKLRKGEYLKYDEDLAIKLFSDGHDIIIFTDRYTHHISHNYRDDHRFRDSKEFKSELCSSRECLTHSRMRFGYPSDSADDLKSDKIELVID